MSEEVIAKASTPRSRHSLPCSASQSRGHCRTLSISIQELSMVIYGAPYKGPFPLRSPVKICALTWSVSSFLWEPISRCRRPWKALLFWNYVRRNQVCYVKSTYHAYVDIGSNKTPIRINIQRQWTWIAIILSLFIKVSRYLHTRFARRSPLNILKRSDSDFRVEDLFGSFSGVVIFK